MDSEPNKGKEERKGKTKRKIKKGKGKGEREKERQTERERKDRRKGVWKRKKVSFESHVKSTYSLKVSLKS